MGKEGVIKNTVDKQVEELINILQTGNEWDAVNAAKKLGQLRAKEAIPVLIDALYSKDSLEAWNALDDTTKIAFGGVGEGIIAINALRRAAAEALGEIGDKKVIPELLAILNSKDVNDLDIRNTVEIVLTNFNTG